MKGESKGLGDTIAKFTEATGIDKLVEKTADLLGIEDCGCTRRQEMLNNWVPYNTTQPTENNFTEQNTDDFTEGIYIFQGNLVFTRDGETYNYKKGNKILIMNDNPFCNDFKYYYKLGVITKE